MQGAGTGQHPQNQQRRTAMMGMIMIVTGMLIQTIWIALNVVQGKQDFAQTRKVFVPGLMKPATPRGTGRDVMILRIWRGIPVMKIPRQAAIIWITTATVKQMKTENRFVVTVCTATG
jgi:hypothetical protein